MFPLVLFKTCDYWYYWSLKSFMTYKKNCHAFHNGAVSRLINICLIIIDVIIQSFQNLLVLPVKLLLLVLFYFLMYYHTDGHCT